MEFGNHVVRTANKQESQKQVDPCAVMGTENGGVSCVSFQVRRRNSARNTKSARMAQK
jgi:hypothetical protein